MAEWSRGQAGFEADDAVSAGAFGLVESFVGAPDGVGRILAMAEASEADADSKAKDAAVDGTLQLLDAVTETFEDIGVVAGSADDQKELFATPPADPIVTAQALAEVARNLNQSGITTGVAELVVDPLKVIEVEQGEGRDTLIAGPGAERIHAADGSAAIGQARKGVFDCLDLQRGTLSLKGAQSVIDHAEQDADFVPKSSRYGDNVSGGEVGAQGVGGQLDGSKKLMETQEQGNRVDQDAKNQNPERAVLD